MFIRIQLVLQTRDGGRGGETHRLSVCADKLKISDSVTSLQLQQSSLNSSVEPVKMCSESFKGPVSSYLDCSSLRLVTIINNYTTSNTIMFVFSQEPVARQHPTTHFPCETAAGPLCTSFLVALNWWINHRLLICDLAEFLSLQPDSSGVLVVSRLCFLSL